jgi:endonuclease/exonuclease/phosphatase (EEP) superfamily protein YafD
MTEIVVQNTASRRRRVGIVSMPLWLAIFALMACQAILWAQPAWPRLAVLEHFALQLSLAALVSMVLALIVRRWIAGALTLFLAITFAWPALTLPGPVAGGAVVGPDRLKIVSANLWARAADHERTLAFLTASDADIIGLVETSPEWLQSLAPLIAKYPYRVDCFAIESVCQTMLLSKLPIARPQAGRVFGAAPLVAGGEIAWNGRSFTILATHLTRPLERSWRDATESLILPGRMPMNRQAEQMDVLARFVNTLPADVIVMGDFNAAPWSRVQRGFRAVTGLGSEAGWAFTWPAWVPTPLRLSIDHVLSRGHVVVTSFETGPETDSDHLPVIAEIGWRD